MTAACGPESTLASLGLPAAQWRDRLDGRPVVVLRGGGLGDLLLSVPALVALRARTRRLVLVARPAYAALLAPLHLADRVIALESAAVASLWSPRPDPALATELADALVLSWLPDVSGELDRGVRALGALGSHWLNGKPERGGPVSGQFCQHLGLPWAPAWRRCIWLPRPVAPPELAGPAPAHCLFLHPGSGSPAKNAPLAWFAGWATAWRAAGGQVVWTAGEADAAVLAALRANHLHPKDELLVNEPLPQLMVRLAWSAGLLSNDTGLAHLAGMLGCPTVVAFQCTDATLWRPLGPHVISLWRPTLERAPARLGSGDFGDAEIGGIQTQAAQ